MDCHMLRHVDNFEGNYTNAERVNFAACGDVESIVIRKEPAIGINPDGTKIFDLVEVKPGSLSSFFSFARSCVYVWWCMYVKR